MRITLFGGTGPSGVHFIHQALGQGHSVVVYARNPSKLAGIDSERLTIVEGPLTDLIAMEQAINEANAVVSFLGPTGIVKGSPLSSGMQNIITAMKKTGVRRLVALATASVADPEDRFDMKYRLMVFTVRMFVRSAYDEIRRMGDAVRISGLDWTIVRVPLLHDKPGSELVKVGYLGDKGLGGSLSRVDLAAFCLQQTEDLTYVRRSPAISS